MTSDDRAKSDETDLERISTATVSDYDRRAGEFWERTRNHDVAQNVDALLRWVKRETGVRILDFGCGPGRDLRVFSDKGHIAIGLDGSRSFVEMARAFSGCEVWRQDFLALDLPDAYFDGVYANATLFHVPRRELRRVLGQIRSTLKKDGVLFASNPRGNDDEGWSGERYGVWHSIEGWRSFLNDAGFVELEAYLRPNDIPVEDRRWLATLWRKVQ